jgi:DNA transposition AAA+ family ATPase
MDTLIQELNKFIKESGLSQNKIANMLSFSSATLSNLINGTYVSKDPKLKEKHFKAIRDLLDKEHARQEDEIGRTIFPFRSTINSRIFFEVADLCDKYCEIGVVTGVQGLGKTRSAKKYKEENSGVILIHVRPSFSTRVFIRKIYEACGGAKISGIDGMVDFCIVKLKGSKKTIIIDQTEYLSDKAIDCLRTIYDECLDADDNGTIGLVMTGLPELLFKLKAFPQFYQRISWFRKLGVYDDKGEYVKGMTDEDVKSFVLSGFNNANGEVKIFDDLSEGNPRVLKKLVDRSRRLCEINKSPLSKEIIKEATRTIVMR